LVLGTDAWGTDNLYTFTRLFNIMEKILIYPVIFTCPQSVLQDLVTLIVRGLSKKNLSLSTPRAKV
jgi:hypothetical protein